jgi:dipeptidyl-peptidase-3
MIITLMMSFVMSVPSALVDRVGNTGFVQVEAESFNTLSPRQKELAYWLSQAAIAIDPITYDQLSRFGLRQKYVLELIAAHNPTNGKILEYTKLFWANHGNHNDVTAQKFLPEFTPEELEASALEALKRSPKATMTADEMRKELVELRASFFDPDFEPQLTAKNPEKGRDIIQASANNFYGPGVTMADLEKFDEKHPLNSRVVKSDGGTLVEEVYRAGKGKYGPYLSKAIEYLRNARKVAEPGQGEVIDALIRYYETGQYQDWLKFGALWARNAPQVDFVNGFIEVYRDARGAKGTAAAYVAVRDEKLNRIMVQIAGNAQYFENHAPWADMYKKLGVKPPLAMAIETVIETGDQGVSTVGQNLPNENEVREKYGTKSFFFTGSTRALNRARGKAAIREFANDDEERRISEEFGEEAADMMTALHEVIGHGSGKVNPKLTEDPSVYLKEYYSTLEETRADLMALWHIWDPKMRELKLVSAPVEVAKAMYYTAARAPLVQLRSIPEGDAIEQDHLRNRQVIVEYIMAEVPGAIERVTREGKTSMRVLDFQKMRRGVGMLLAEIMRIKGEGDYAAAKALIDRYGVRFDPKIRDEVVERYRKLDIPAYWSGVNPELRATMTKGRVKSVTMTYPRDLVSQRIGYGAMFLPELRGH